MILCTTVDLHQILATFCTALSDHPYFNSFLYTVIDLFSRLRAIHAALAVTTGAVFSTVLAYFKRDQPNSSRTDHCRATSEVNQRERAHLPTFELSGVYFCYWGRSIQEIRVTLVIAQVHR